jgi:hypothetical protein
MSTSMTEATVLASWGAVSAITYIMRPEVWPGFAAWAEQKLPGTTWTKDERAGFEWVLDFFVAVARRLDKEDDDGDRG